MWASLLSDPSKITYPAGYLDICSCPRSVGRPFIRLIKDNISSRLFRYALVQEVWVRLLSDSSKITYPAGYLDICSCPRSVGRPFIRPIKDNISSRLRSSSKDVFQPSVFLIQRKCPASLLISYLYLETVQFKLSLDSFGEIYQLNHWKELNFKAAIISSDLSK